MAASYTYGVTNANVIAELPGMDSANFGASTEPVSTGDIDQWIDDASARINAMLDKSGIEGSASLDADALAFIATGVKAYAVWKTCQVVGITGPLLEEAKDNWLQVHSELSNRPQSLGDAYDDGLTTNIDTDTKSEDWSFIDNEGSLW